MDRDPFSIRSPWAGCFAQGSSHPHVLTLYRGWTRLSTDSLDELRGLPLHGFFEAGTLLITHYRIRLQGQPIRNTFCAQLSANEWASVGIVPGSPEQGDLPEGHIPRGSLEGSVRRRIGGGWRERILVRNHSSRDAREARLEIELSCPILDVELDEEMKSEGAGDSSRLELPHLEGKKRSSRRAWLRVERYFGRRRHTPTEELRRLLGDRAPKDGDPVVRALEIEMEVRGSDAALELRRDPQQVIAVQARLPPLGHFLLQIRFVPIIDGRRREAPTARAWQPLPRRPPEHLRRDTRVTTGNPNFNLILAQAQMDLEELRLPVFGDAPSDRVPHDALNAGVPRYLGIFSRDILTTSWQAGLLTLRYLECSLERTAAYRGVRREDWRDEEPDRLPHERRLNPKAAIGETNRELYYGDSVSTLFWIATLASAYNWTGQRDLLQRHEKDWEACVRWMRRKLEEGQGFIYYAPSSGGAGKNRHHAWKDSGDAIVDGRGRVRVPPLATAELQGYCYLGLLASAEIALALGHPLRALEFQRQSAELKQRFHDRFWMSEHQFYALALDARGKPIDAIASNIGHCLGCGIVDRAYASRVARRLMAPDLFSGWGIRTLSSRNPAYDPFSYHRGSVWPVENATIAGGMRLYGFHAYARRIIEGQLAAATLFPRMRLPEVMSGHPRGARYPIPGLYPYSNLLQAWSVSAIPFSLQILLGLRPLAPLRTLLIKPDLPPWLPWVRLEKLRVGGATVALEFWRNRRGATSWRILDKQGVLAVVEATGAVRSGERDS